MMGKHFVGLYFAQASFGATYSSAGSPIIVLLWVYYSAQIFFGANLLLRADSARLHEDRRITKKTGGVESLNSEGHL